MAATKRTPIQIQEDRTKIARWYLQGRTQAQIAVDLGVSSSQVFYDLKAIQKEWREQRFSDIDQIKADQLAKIDEVERVAWEAFKRSQEDRVISIAEMKTDAANPKDAKSKTSMKKEGQAGDPRFLERISWAIEQRLKLFGLYAPAKIAISDLDALIEKELSTLSGESAETDKPRSDLVC